jgi:hypothetical protein
MEIIARYTVAYVIRLGDVSSKERTAECLLSANYSDFEDIRQMLAQLHSVRITDIDVQSATKVDQQRYLKQLCVDDQSIDEAHSYRTKHKQVEAARAAYVEALRTDGQTDLADLVDGLNARTWPVSDGDDADTSPRYVVDLFGLTVDVRNTRDGLTVDLRSDELEEKYQPVNVNLGTNALTDDGHWTTTFDGRQA